MSTIEPTDDTLLAIAPMVKLGDHAFRHFVHSVTSAHLSPSSQRRLIAYSPMLLAHEVVEVPGYLESHIFTCEHDAPLIVQLAGREPTVLRDAAARIVRQFGDVVGIDLNLGCPQDKARDMCIGAFMAANDEFELIESCVAHTVLGAGRRLPVSVKIRIDERPWATEKLVDIVRRGGASLIAVHARTWQQGRNGAADWDAIASVVQWASPVPVLANGGCCTPCDVSDVLAHTGAAGVMSAEPLLVDPFLFARWCCRDNDDEQRQFPSQVETARLFVECARHNAHASDASVDSVRHHLLHILGLRERSRNVFRRMGLSEQFCGTGGDVVRAAVDGASTLDELAHAVELCSSLQQNRDSDY